MNSSVSIVAAGALIGLGFYYSEPNYEMLQTKDNSHYILLNKRTGVSCHYSLKFTIATEKEKAYILSSSGYNRSFEKYGFVNDGCYPAAN